MKGKIIFGIIAVLVVVGIVLGIVFWPSNPSTSTDDAKEGAPEPSIDLVSLLNKYTVEEVKQQASVLGIELLQNDEVNSLSFTGLKVNQASVMAYFQMEGTKIVETFAKLEYPLPKLEDAQDNVNEMMSIIDEATFYASDLFDTNMQEYVKIFHNEGMLLQNDDSKTYESLANSEAQIFYIVKDTAQTYWRVTGKTEGDVFAVYMERYNSSISDEDADVILQQES